MKLTFIWSKYGRNEAGLAKPIPIRISTFCIYQQVVKQYRARTSTVNTDTHTHLAVTGVVLNSFENVNRKAAFLSQH